MTGKLLVFEGTDCSGKSTQIGLFKERLTKNRKTWAMLDFPNYTTPTGRIVRMYLDGRFGPANDVPAKLASVLYAEDRFASKPLIEKALAEKEVVILDRYVESNMGHQGGKIRDPASRLEFFEWNKNLEYGNFGLPRPNAVVFLYMPPVVSAELMKNRVRKSENHPGAQKLDGHEGNSEHMRNAAESYLQLADLYNWIRIDCAPNGAMKSLKTPEEIAEEVFLRVESVLAGN